jgi:hypothetical protein
MTNEMVITKEEPFGPVAPLYSLKELAHHAPRFGIVTS